MKKTLIIIILLIFSFSFTYADLSSEMINEEVSKLEKCIFFGTVIKTKAIRDGECFEIINLNISGNNGGFKIGLQKIPVDVSCFYDLVGVLYGKYENTPKIGDKVDFLIGKQGNNNILLSNEKVGEGKYKITSGDILEGNFETCEPNYQFIIGSLGMEIKYIKSIQMGSLIFGMIIILLKKLTKNPKKFS